MECKWNAVLWAGLSLALLCFYHFLLTLNRIAWGLSVHSLATPWLCSAIIITPVESSLKIVIVISIFVDHFQQFQLLLSVDNWLLEMFSCKCFIVNTDYILNMIWFNFYFWIVSNFSFFFVFFLINFFLEMFSCKCFIVNTDCILNMIWFNFYFWIVSNFSFFFCKKKQRSAKESPAQRTAIFHLNAIMVREFIGNFYKHFYLHDLSWSPLWAQSFFARESGSISKRVFIETCLRYDFIWRG